MQNRRPAALDVWPMQCWTNVVTVGVQAQGAGKTLDPNQCPGSDALGPRLPRGGAEVCNRALRCAATCEGWPEARLATGMAEVEASVSVEVTGHGISSVGYRASGGAFDHTCRAVITQAKWKGGGWVGAGLGGWGWGSRGPRLGPRGRRRRYGATGKAGPRTRPLGVCCCLVAS